ncbi:lipopolysaccharide biosynthesis protein [Croceicoccus sediminis]|uniref:lipopolysaccharide biosynthesis protein n=1 Tax=Croceicoccus sediminis TaxID=2571150 RepID=UPI001182CAEC|nr:hypothetical protein [Croceicoccus sediminis]
MWLTGSAIAAIRVATLAMRFALTIYVTAVLGLAEMGRLGLVQGLTALVPSVVGMGLNFHMCRDLVGRDPADRIAIVRDRMAFTARLMGIVAVPGVIGVWIFDAVPGTAAILITAILVAEVWAMDAYIALTGMRMNVIANWGVLLRTAAWVPAVIVCGLADSGLRTLDFVYAGWLLGHAANFAMMAGMLHARGLWHRWREDDPTGWVGTAMPGAMRIWPSDIALALITYGDRFILSAVVGDRMLGVYVFFWTFANMIRTLLQSAIVTPALPRLIDLYRKDRGGWQNTVRRLGAVICVAAIAVSVMALAMIWIGHRYVPQSNFPWQAGLAFLIFSAVLAGYFGDYLSTVLNSAGAVTAYAGLNIAFAVCMIIAIASGALLGGVVGATLGSLSTALLFAGLKIAAIRRV